MATIRSGRRDFLKGMGLGTAALASGGLLACRPSEPFPEPGSWIPGSVAHLIPTASHDRILLKSSFHEPPRGPVLHVGERRVAGRATDGSGRFFDFDVKGLEPATTRELSLRDARGQQLCDPWPLRTFPHPSVLPERFRLLAYTCAGGSDLFLHPLQGWLFLATPTRQRLLARALCFEPDAAIAIGDHVYWDMRSWTSLGMGRSPQARWSAGHFDRTQAIFGTPNEEVLRRAFGPQIAGLYGTRFRSLPMFFVQDDHDYGENDIANDEIRTFPPDRFMLELAGATRRMYYPPPLEGLSEPFGMLRYGRLFEALLYDCRRFVRNARDGATHSAFLPAEAERWLLERSATSDAVHLAHVPSTPILWTAGKWGEWYPDFHDDSGRLRIDIDKPWWPHGWLEQHDRLLAGAAQRRDRTPLFVSGDLHATGAGAITRSGSLDLSANPVVSLLSGTPGTHGPGWPSKARGQRPVPSAVLDAEEWIPPLEENGFTLLEFDAQGVRLAFFRWRPEQGEAAIDSLEPFAVREIPRPRA